VVIVIAVRFSQSITTLENDENNERLSICTLV